MNAARTTFLVATAVHAGFQITVTTLVYPALARVRDHDWRHEHDLHSRAIVPLVGAVYLFLAGSTIWLLIVDHRNSVYAGAVSAFAVAAVTAFGAAPLHGRLTERRPALIERLIRLDRWRAASAILLLGCGVAVVLG